MTLEAEHTQDPAVAPADHRAPSQTPPAWRGHPVQMQLPPKTGPVKVTLAGVPLVKGFFIMTGCRMTFLGVTWLQPWSHKPLTFGMLRKKKKNFTLFSDHNGSLLRRQPGALWYATTVSNRCTLSLVAIAL